jgi:hypothetical protein
MIEVHPLHHRMKKREEREGFELFILAAMLIQFQGGTAVESHVPIKR